jgi:hypothetical protein
MTTFSCVRGHYIHTAYTWTHINKNESLKKKKKKKKLGGGWRELGG